MRFEEVFRVAKPLIGVLHLPPLPGAPNCTMGLSEVLERALRDAEALASGGVDAIIVENFGDRPMRRSRAHPATIASMAVVVQEVVKSTGLPVGVNVLRNDAVAALSIAHVCGGRFIRVNAYAEVVASDQGLLEPAAWRVQFHRRYLGASVLVLADVIVKHGAPLTPPSAALAARSAVYRGLADAVIVTGAETGGEAPLERLVEVKKAVEAPVLVGSGVTPENVARYRDADGFIVGTYLHERGDTSRPISLERVRRMAAAVERLR